jgi:hypothetical protein
MMNLGMITRFGVKESFLTWDTTSSPYGERQILCLQNVIEDRQMTGTVTLEPFQTMWAEDLDIKYIIFLIFAIKQFVASISFM